MVVGTDLDANGSSPDFLAVEHHLVEGVHQAAGVALHLQVLDCIYQRSEVFGSVGLLAYLFRHVKLPLLSHHQLVVYLARTVVGGDGAECLVCQLFQIWLFMTLIQKVHHTARRLPDLRSVWREEHQWRRY